MHEGAKALAELVFKPEKEMPKPGPDQKIPNDQLALALWLSRGLVSLTAQRLGVNPKYVYRKLRSSAKLREVQEFAKELAMDKVEDVLMDNAEKGESWAVKFMLSSASGKSRGYGPEANADGNLTIRVVRDSEDPVIVDNG